MMSKLNICVNDNYINISHGKQLLSVLEFNKITIYKYKSTKRYELYLWNDKDKIIFNTYFKLSQISGIEDIEIKMVGYDNNDNRWRNI